MRLTATLVDQSEMYGFRTTGGQQPIRTNPGVSGGRVCKCRRSAENIQLLAPPQQPWPALIGVPIHFVGLGTPILAVWVAKLWLPLSSELQCCEDLVEQGSQLIQKVTQVSRVEEVGHGAKQVAEEVPMARNSRNIQYDLVQMDSKP